MLISIIDNMLMTSLLLCRKATAIKFSIAIYPNVKGMALLCR
jgi:hypothetical protein